MSPNPAFGQADLTNCERELIHLAASTQPHGVLMVLRESDRMLLQVSASVQSLLGVGAQQMLGQTLAALQGDIDERVRALAMDGPLDEPVVLRTHVRVEGRRIDLEGSLHRAASGSLIVELEPLVSTGPVAVEMVAPDPVALHDAVAAAIQRFSAAANIGTLCDGVVRSMRDLTGYDRVMVYKFDSDGHGKIIAEARHPRLESLLGHHYPASDIPQRARELYLRNRVRVLVDVNYEPAALLPRLSPLDGCDLDMSLCYLRSMSPLHLQYLKNMGVTATLVVSLVREGRLWGLIAAHHYTPRNLRLAVRSASELLAEVIATRIAAIENYAHAQVAISVRRLEQRLIDATSTEGDWRLALFRNPRTLLQPLDATGAALFHDGEVQTTGEVPSTPELRALLRWVDGQRSGHGGEVPFHCASVARANPALAALTPTASGVLAVPLSASRPDYLMWFRKEQLLTVTWAGDPNKMVIGNDPMDLSPRRSFAAWSELVQGTALEWTTAELAMARAMGFALIDIIVQVQGVRLLIAHDQLAHIRASVEGSAEAVAVADASGRVLHLNQAFAALLGPSARATDSLDDVAKLFTDVARAQVALATLKSTHQAWRGELAIARGAGAPLPVSLRAEVVLGSDGNALGFMLILQDLSEHMRVAAARRQLELSLSTTARSTAADELAGPHVRETDTVINAILGNASVAAMDIADSGSGPYVAPLLQELEISTRRAAQLYRQIRALDR